LEKKSGRGQRELALNLPNVGELVVFDAGEFLAEPQPLAQARSGTQGCQKSSVERESNNECCLAFLFFHYGINNFLNFSPYVLFGMLQ
jgi:hypothetical protein